MVIVTSNQAVKHPEQPSFDDVVDHLLEDADEHAHSLMRPPVAPVYGVCGHIARSAEHTCGAWSCTQMYDC